jgi:alpha-tubulin suppressor-like RCC1 family protein
LVLTNEGEVYGWGYNEYGQISSDPKIYDYVLSPTLIHTFQNFKKY